MSDKIEIESDNYKLSVFAERREETYEVTSDHYYTSERTRVWFSGHGSVLMKEEHRKYPFLVRLTVRRAWHSTGDDLASLLNLKGVLGAEGDNTIVDKQRYVDLCLKEWWLSAKVANEKAGMGIPTVTEHYCGAIFPVPDYAALDFVGLGICLDSDGQRRLPGVDVKR